MSTPQNPLDQLKDIHLPEQLNQFELAFGWWIVIAIVASLLIYLAIRWYKKRKALHLLKPANVELDKIAQLTPNNFAMAELSALLKRICLIYFPKQQVAALSGESWTRFLNQQTQRELFDTQQQRIFSQLTYQANQELSPEEWEKIVANSRIAINCIIRNAVKKSPPKSSKEQ